METKKYFEKVMQDDNRNRKGRSLCKHCSDEGVDYKWLVGCKESDGTQKKVKAFGRERINVIFADTFRCFAAV